MLKKMFSILVVVTLMSGAFVFAPTSLGLAQAAPSGNSITYNVYATDGYMNLADNSSLYIYGFIGGRSTDNLVYYNYGARTAVNTGAPAPAPSGGVRTAAEAALAGHAQLPGPAIYAATGDVVEIRLKNLGIQANPAAPNDPHSIHLHGLDVDAANDGVPETSVGAVPANLCSDGRSDTTSPYDCTGMPVDVDQGYEADPGLAPGAGNVVVYMFSADKVGTSMWHCHQEADIHVQMGMYGALVIYNPTDPAYLNGGPGGDFGGTYNGFKYDRDVILLLSEVDVHYHQSEEGVYPSPAASVAVLATDGKTYQVLTDTVAAEWNPVQYKPQYWLINGLSFPDTVHANQGVDFAQWSQAFLNYDPYIQGSVGITTGAYSYSQWKTKGEKILLRMINMGYETQPMHIHGYHLKVLGSDQRPWPWANRVLWGKPTPFDQGLEKNTILIGSGETYELLLDMGQQSTSSVYADGTGGLKGTFSGGTQTRYDAGAGNAPRSNTSAYPTIPDAGDPTPGHGTYIGGPTVTGLMLPLPGAVVNVPTTGQLFPFHNHDDYKATNNGFYPGGQFTAVHALP